MTEFDFAQIPMGAGCSFSVEGSNSDDLKTRGDQEGEEEKLTVQEKASEQNQPFLVHIPEERSRENSGSTNLEIVSQSQCEVKLTRDYGLDSDFFLIPSEENE